ncbi:putative ER to Golgi transport-related protein [Exidia glandulosa HHB12029]|uniref:Putative ER to Golgi transport-related protein n=1 Tax=Exidia glandulosa HHB12029 TaxID=1314781 RepID=A0A165K690_EXIGL|nr:putative ER to Golgi transport-related protein [Exidia glandulosa HHB12029]
MSQQNDLPPGWIAQWDPTHQRHLFIETTSGHQQWEHPLETAGGPLDATVAPAPAPSGHGKRRAYAVGQTHAYDGAGEVAPYPDAAGYGAPVQPGMGGAPAPLFTPGLANDQFAAQQQAAQGQGYYGGSEQYPAQQPAYGQQQPMQYPPVNQLADQFGHMGLGGQKPFALHTANLVATPPNPLELLMPPPEIRLPPGASITDSPAANADPSYMRSTINVVPTTYQLLNKSKLPFSLVLTPHRTLKSAVNSSVDDPPVPVVTDTVIARCRRCRSYINPYVTFIDGGQRWKCCLCSMSNEVPQMFDWDQARNQPGDRWSRPELTSGAVEFVAPTEYMVRPPQPLVYVFLIDVSHAAVQSGMVATATRTILESLDRIPNDDNRTRISLIAFDTALYFFSLTPGSTETSMLVVSDIDDVFLPKPNDQLVLNLTESRAAVETLLGRLQEMFQDTQIIGSALGPALQAGFQLASTTGGKLITLSASLPTLGVGALKNREDPKILGTPKESALLQAGSPFYKTFAIECSRAQVSVDMFLFAATYTDVASLSCLPHYTSGQTFFYPGFNAARSEDAIKFAHEFGIVLGSQIGLEAVIRVRASRGIHMSAFHGNFFVRSTDLLALPAVPPDQNYVIEISLEETLTTPFVVFQTAVLHTTCFGERRIRVITLALPTTSNISELYASVDQIAVATFLANKAVERTQANKLEDARDMVQKYVTDILGAYKSNMTGGGGAAAAGLAIPTNMQMFPLLALGLLKHVALRQSSQIAPDLRAYAHSLLTTLPSQTLIPYLHPSFYSLHDMPPECGTIGDAGVILPPLLPLTSERLVKHGLFVIEDGQTIFLWVGRDSVPQLIMDVFNLPNYEALRGGKYTLPILDNPFSQRVNAIIGKIREMRRGPYYPALFIVKEDGEPPMRLWALSALIQDRGDQTPSYQQWLGQLKDKLNGSSYN